MTDLTSPIYHDEEAARRHYEIIRWPDGRTCHHCGTVGNSVLMQGKSTRPGLYKCRDCRKPFTATMGTIYERSHIPLHKWLLASHLMATSKKGISAHQLFRQLGFGSYRTAWFMAMRIREAMRNGPNAPMGEGGAPVEVDEAFIGRKKGKPVKAGGGHKMKIVSVVDRTTGEARSAHIPDSDPGDIADAVIKEVAPEAHLMTDGARTLMGVGREFAQHSAVNHSTKEYVRGAVHVNTVEGFFSIFKRGMQGVYQHCDERYLQRYLDEFDFRYSYRAKMGVNDAMRARLATAGTVGRRLTGKGLRAVYS